MANGSDVVKRVLLVRAGALGDVLLLRPAVVALKKTGARVALLAPAHSGVALVGPGPSEVDGLIPWDRADVARLMGEPADVSPTLRRELGAFDLAIAYTRNTGFVGSLAALVPTVVAWDPTPPPGGFHAARYLAEPLIRLGFEVDPDPPACLPAPGELESAAGLAAQLPPGFVAVHPGSGSPAKNWPAASFAALLESLAAGGPWLLVEGPADELAAESLRRRPRAVVAKELPPRVLGALLSRCGLFVGNDSGVSHLAAAFGAPVVALFGPTDPALWRPLGVQVCAPRSPTGRMDDLGLEDVKAACLALSTRQG